MSRLRSNEVLSGLFDVSAHEIQNIMGSNDYDENDLSSVQRIKKLKQEATNTLEQENEEEEEEDSDKAQRRSLSKNAYHHEILIRKSDIEKEKEDLLDEEEERRSLFILPDMWSFYYIGLYSQYAAVGLLYGMVGTLLPFCVYSYDGPTNVCANAKNIVFFAWSFKLFYAILTDAIHPFGLRRKPWMIAGWSMVLMILLVLAIAADKMNVSTWLISLLSVQFFLMLSDVPADGYSVELGQLEIKEKRGQILATGQRIRFTFCVIAGVIQTFLLNGPQTNDSDCEISIWQCWSWGLTVNQYYALLFVMVFFLTLPVWWLKEIEAKPHHRHVSDGSNTSEGFAANAAATTVDNPNREGHRDSGFYHFLNGLWQTLQNLTTFYLIVFVIGIQGLTQFTNNANIELQYYVIKLTNFQAGIDTVTTYGALVLAIWLFQKYLINRNWRYTQYSANIVSSLFGLLWIPAYYNVGGLMNGWYTIFIDLDTVRPSFLSAFDVYRFFFFPPCSRYLLFFDSFLL
jgi:hypothetical protein